MTTNEKLHQWWSWLVRSLVRVLVFLVVIGLAAACAYLASPILTNHIMWLTPLANPDAWLLGWVVKAAMLTGLVVRVIHQNLWANILTGVGVTGTGVALAVTGWLTSGIPGALWLLVLLVILLVAEQTYLSIVSTNQIPEPTRAVTKNQTTVPKALPVTDQRLVGIAQTITSEGGKPPGRTKIQNRFDLNQSDARRVVSLINQNKEVIND